jgi:acyl-CoA synthetase (NDP forming)
MLKSIEESPIFRIANPRSIAFFGASNNITSMGTNLLASLRALGFEGPVYPIHPKEKEVQTLRAYRSVLDLPEVPDLAVMVLPTRIVSEALEMCGRKGVKRAIVVSGGFKEVGGSGPDLEEEIIAIARKYGMRILGPNCIGVANPHHKLNTTFMPDGGAPGFIGLASQSGSFVTQMFDYLAGLGLGFSTALSVGNEANLDLVDCMEYLGACPHTKVVALYIEDIKRGEDFLKTARSIVPYKPVVAFYVGGSETGRRASLSHTGAMSGPDLLYDGVFRQSGIIRARTLTELFDFCWVLGTMPRTRGRNVVIQTHSGGPGAAAADACGRAGLELPALSRETMEKLGPFVPHTASISNPVDLTFAKNPMDFFSKIPEVLLEDENLHMLLVYCFTPSRNIDRALEFIGVPKEETAAQSSKIIQAQCDAMLRCLEDHGKPVVGYTWRGREDGFIRGLLDRGMPVFPGPERAARAMEALARYASSQNEKQSR